MDSLFKLGTKIYLLFPFIKWSEGKIITYVAEVYIFFHTPQVDTNSASLTVC